MEHLQIPPKKCLAKAKITSNAMQLLLGCLQFGHIGEILSGGGKKKIANVVMKAIHFTPQTSSGTYIALH